MVGEVRRGKVWKDWSRQGRTEMGSRGEVPSGLMLTSTGRCWFQQGLSISSSGSNTGAEGMKQRKASPAQGQQSESIQKAVPLIDTRKNCLRAQMGGDRRLLLKANARYSGNG